MSGAGQGGVGVRLYTTGSEVVRRNFGEVGDSGKRMWSEIALGQKSVNPAFRALSAGVGEAKGEILALAGRAGGAGVALGAFGAAGVAASLVIVGLAAGMMKAREAMDFADEIDDTANKLAIGTTALQQYRYAMTAVGGSAEDADTAIQSFTEKLGEAQAGGRALRWFDKIGFSREQLQGYDTAEAALGDVIDRLAGLNKETERQAVSSKIGLGSMVALTREGQAGVEALMQAALDLGYVMDEELVKNGAEANQKFEEMSTIIDVQMKSAFVSLAPVILELADFFVYLAQTIADVADSWRDLDSRSTRGLMKQDAALAAQQMQLLRGKSSPNELNGYGRAAWDRINTSRGQIAEQLAGRTPDAPRDRPNELEDRPNRARAPRSSSAGRSEEQRQRERERALSELERAEMEARRAAIDARYGPGGPEESALRLGQERLIIENEAINASRIALTTQLEATGLHDAEGRARLEQLRLAQEELGVLKATALDQEDRRRLTAKRLDEEVGADQAAIDLLSIEEQMAGTARERYEIGRRILEAEHALELKIEDAQMRADNIISEAEQERYDSILKRQGAEVEAAVSGEEDRVRSLFKQAGKDLVGAIEDGNVGEFIGEKLKAKMLDGALESLFAMINKIPGPTGGGVAQKGFNWLASAFLGGFADGGYVRGPGGPREDRIPALLSNGEFVVNAKATQLMRPLLERMNLGIAGFSGGGLVGTPEHGPQEMTIGK